jgi:hypothetical protein
MLGEATLDVLGTFLDEAIRFPIQIAALQFAAPWRITVPIGRTMPRIRSTPR